MMKILTDIPGFERRKLHCIDCSDKGLKIIGAGKIIGQLRSKYGTSVAYFSTHSTSANVEKFQEEYANAVGHLYATDLDDKDVHRLCDSIKEMVDQKFVRAVVIDSLEDLDIAPDCYTGGIRAKRSEIKTQLYFTACTCDIPILLYCQYRRSHKYEKEYTVFTPDILSQFSE